LLDRSHVYRQPGSQGADNERGDLRGGVLSLVRTNISFSSVQIVCLMMSMIPMLRSWWECRQQAQ